MDNPCAVLLTGTIDPGPYKNLIKRNNPEDRLNDYIESLDFWTSLKTDKIKSIIFCENSGVDMTEMRSRYSGSKIPVEFISFKGNKKPPNMHYGFNELEIIDYAFIHSEKLSEVDFFIKVTGRLRYPNILKFIKSLPSFFDLAVDHRGKYKNEKGCPYRVRTQLIAFNKNFYKENLYSKKDEMIGLCSHIEEFIAIKCLEFNGATIIKRFKVECIPKGRSGTLDESYSSLIVLFKSFVRSLFRKIMPILWI